MQGIVVLGTLIVVLQGIFSLFQIRYYQRFVKQLIQRYKNKSGYQLNTEVAKNWYSSVVLVVVTNTQGKIIEAYTYSGLTIFSRFTSCEALVGEQTSQELLKEWQAKKSCLHQKVILSFLDKKMKPIT